MACNSVEMAIGAGSPVMTNMDVIRSLREFAGDKQFLFFAPVSKGWREAWGSRTPATTWVTSDSTVPQLLYSFACGLPRNDPSLCAAVARLGNVHLLQCAQEEGCPWDERTCAEAAAGGHLTVLRWARENGCPWDNRTCVRAAAGGHLGVFDWAQRNGCPQDYSTAATLGSAEYRAILLWGRENGCAWGERTCAVAAAGGFLAVLQKQSKNEGLLTWGRARNAVIARGGFSLVQKMLQCARAQGRDWDETTCVVAAAGAHLAVLLYDRQNTGRPWNWVTSAVAARAGHVPVLQWASWCPALGIGDSPLIASGEYLAAVRWALENGCPCDERTEQWADGRL